MSSCSSGLVAGHRSVLDELLNDAVVVQAQRALDLAHEFGGSDPEVPGKLFKLLADADTRAALLLLTAPSIDGLLQASAQQQVHPTTESQTSPMPQPLPANKTTSAGTSEEQHESTASDHSFSACQWVLQRLASNQGAAPEQEACDVLPSPWLTSALASIPATTIQAARNRLQEQCRQQHSAPQGTQCESGSSRPWEGGDWILAEAGLAALRGALCGCSSLRVVSSSQVVHEQQMMLACCAAAADVGGMAAAMLDSSVIQSVLRPTPRVVQTLLMAVWTLRVATAMPWHRRPPRDLILRVFQTVFTVMVVLFEKNSAEFLKLSGISNQEHGMWRDPEGQGAGQCSSQLEVAIDLRGIISGFTAVLSNLLPLIEFDGSELLLANTVMLLKWLYQHNKHLITDPWPQLRLHAADSTESSSTSSCSRGNKTRNNTSRGSGASQSVGTASRVASAQSNASNNTSTARPGGCSISNARTPAGPHYKGSTVWSPSTRLLGPSEMLALASQAHSLMLASLHLTEDSALPSLQLLSCMISVAMDVTADAPAAVATFTQLPSGMGVLRSLSTSTAALFRAAGDVLSLAGALAQQPDRWQQQDTACLSPSSPGGAGGAATCEEQAQGATSSATQLQAAAPASQHAGPQRQTGYAPSAMTLTAGALAILPVMAAHTLQLVYETSKYMSGLQKEVNRPEVQRLIASDPLAAACVCDMTLSVMRVVRDLTFCGAAQTAEGIRVSEGASSTASGTAEAAQQSKRRGNHLIQQELHTRLVTFNSCTGLGQTLPEMGLQCIGVLLASQLCPVLWQLLGTATTCRTIATGISPAAAASSRCSPGNRVVPTSRRGLAANAASGIGSLAQQEAVTAGHLTATATAAHTGAALNVTCHLTTAGTANTAGHVSSTMAAHAVDSREPQLAKLSLPQLPGPSASAGQPCSEKLYLFEAGALPQTVHLASTLAHISMLMHQTQGDLRGWMGEPWGDVFKSQDNSQLWLRLIPLPSSVAPDCDQAFQPLNDITRALRLMYHILLPLQMLALDSQPATAAVAAPKPAQPAQPPKALSRAERRREQRLAEKSKAASKQQGTTISTSSTPASTSRSTAAAPTTALGQGLRERLCQALCSHGSAEQYLRDLSALERDHPIKEVCMCAGLTKAAVMDHVVPAEVARSVEVLEEHPPAGTVDLRAVLDSLESSSRALDKVIQQELVVRLQRDPVHPDCSRPSKLQQTKQAAADLACSTHLLRYQLGAVQRATGAMSDSLATRMWQACNKQLK